MLTDDELVHLAREGRDGAYEELVRRHQGEVFRTALRMVGNRTDAEDITQDVFVRAWRALPRFRGDSLFSTWLYRVVVNQCLSSERRRRADAILAERADTAPGPSQHAEGRAQLEDLYRALRALTAEQRAVVVLREFEGLSYDEIAVVLDITVPAVKSRLHRARLEVATALRAWT